MVRESRLLWNDSSDDRLRAWPAEDETDDWDESPLEPPPQRRCTRRGQPCRSRDSAWTNAAPTSPAAPGNSSEEEAM